MNDQLHPKQIPFGLLELDAAGTVFCYKPDIEEDTRTPELDIIGKNFFTDVVPVAQAAELQAQFKRFRECHDPIRSLTFTFKSEHESIPTIILLASMREQSAQSRAETILVHIRKAKS